jgi:hypothetical protein
MMGSHPIAAPIASTQRDPDVSGESLKGTRARAAAPNPDGIGGKIA